jgi:hypothetical protein
MIFCVVALGVPRLGARILFCFTLGFPHGCRWGSGAIMPSGWERAKWGTAVTPFTPLRTAAKNGHEESVSYVAKNQRLGRISLLFTNGV